MMSAQLGTLAELFVVPASLWVKTEGDTLLQIHETNKDSVFGGISFSKTPFLGSMSI